MAAGELLRNKLEDLLVDEIRIEIDVRQVEVVGQILKNNFLAEEPEPNQELLKALASLLLLKGLLELLRRNHAQIDQIFAKTSSFIDHGLAFLRPKVPFLCFVRSQDAFGPFLTAQGGWTKRFE